MEGKSFVFLFLCVSIASVARSQAFIEGVVVDQATEMPIAFVNISAQNKLVGTISNTDGKYRLDTRTLTDADTLLFSHISFTTLRISLGALKSISNKIKLTESLLLLKEITVNAARNDLDLFEDIIAETKRSAGLPLNYTVYYREWVKESASYNRFADGVLNVAYPQDKEKMKFQVSQSRAFKLPKDDDELFDITSPVKLEFVLNNAYIDFLNRFRNEKSKDYNVVSYPGTSFDDFYFFTIAPKKEVVRDNSVMLHTAKLKVSQDRRIKEVEIKTDSLSAYESTFLGLKMKVLEGQTRLSFKEMNGRNYLAFAKMEFKLRFSFGKRTQTSVYTSEFVVLHVADHFTEIPRKDQFKKSALFKSGNKYSLKFWEGIEMPLISEQEKAVIESLERKSKETTSK
jgi:hypothetical protein